MIKLNKLLISAFVLSASLLTGCSNENTITVCASELPHAKILNEAIKPILKEKGYNLKVTVLDWTIQNSAVANDEYDANYFDIGLGAKYRISYKANAYLLVSWHAFAEARTGGFRVDTGWFTDPIPSITFGVEIN